MNKEFKVGDVVCLKSGGADMTIIAIDEINQMVECVWHIKREPKQATYPIDAIEISNGNEYDF